MKKTRCVVGSLLVILVGVLFLPALLRAQEPPAKGDGWFANWSPDLVLEAKVGTERNIGTAELMLPLTQAPDSVWFMDMRARYDDDGNSFEGNLGLGYRTTLNDCWIWGVYAFADMLDSAYDNTFWGGTLGSELMSENVIFRVNGYMPETGSQDVDLAAAKIVGNSIVVVGENAKERALPGGDLEVGYRFASLIPGMESQDMWLYVGGFYFDASGYEKVAGPRVRAEWNIDTDFAIAGSQFTVGGEWQTDDQRDGQAYLTVALRIPLGGGEVAKGEKDWRRRSLWRRIVRDVDIVSGVSGLDEETPAINPLTGQPYGSAVYADGRVTPGEGDLENPTTLGDAVDKAGEYGVIVGLGGNGNIGVGAGQDLQEGQLLSGGGGTIRVATGSGRILPLRLPGTPGTIEGTGTGDDYLIGLADNNTIQNLTFVAGGPSVTRKDPEVAAVYGNGIENAVLRDLIIDGAHPVVDRGDGDLLARGIDIDNASGTVEVDNVSISNTSKEAIKVKGDKDGVSALDVMFSNILTDSAGAVKAEELQGGNVSVDRLTVTNQSGKDEALKVKDGGTVRVRNVAVTGGGQVKIEESAGDVSVENCSITDMKTDDKGKYKDAFEIKKTTGTVTLNNNHVVNLPSLDKAGFKIDTAGDIGGTGNTTDTVTNVSDINGVAGAGKVRINDTDLP